MSLGVQDALDWTVHSGGMCFYEIDYSVFAGFVLFARVRYFGTRMINYYPDVWENMSSIILIKNYNL